MAKSVKLQNNIFLDTSSVVHGHNTLKNIMSKNTIHNGKQNGQSGKDLTATTNVLISTINCRTGRILVSYYISCGVDANNAWLDVLIDNNLVSRVGVNRDVFVSLTRMFEVSIGNHTVILRLTRNNNNTMYYNDYPPPQLDVCEI